MMGFVQLVEVATKIGVSIDFEPVMSVCLEDCSHLFCPIKYHHKYFTAFACGNLGVLQNPAH